MASAPKVSVVIPCYNHGVYVQDAIDSVEASTYKGYELIIVNDGSTDALTIQKMDELMQRGYNIINQPNQGVSSTRNNGIAAASGRYIMPLDADNKIRPTYIEKAIGVLDSQPGIGVVYGKSAYFGEVNTGCGGESFNPTKLYRGGHIDTLAVFRKSAWEDAGGYDPNMPMLGNEDWDFWLTLHENGIGFHFIDEVLFDYRVVSGSLLHKLKQSEKWTETIYYIATKHGAGYWNQFFEVSTELEYAKSRPLNFLLKQKFNWLYKLLSRHSAG